MPVAVRLSPFERAAREFLANKRAAEDRLANSSSEDSSIQPTANTLGGIRPVGAWVADFLGALTQGLPVRRAVKVAGVHETLVYKRRANDETFRAAWNEACELGTELLEQEAQRRAYHGTLKPIYYKGELCGSERKFSDTLMIFLLKGRKPEVYRDGVEDGDKRGSFVVNINVETVGQVCKHEYLNEEGYCRACGADCRGIGNRVILPPTKITEPTDDLPGLVDVEVVNGPVT